jgi:hypothetical protein
MTALHALRCMGFATLPRVADALGRSESTVESELNDLAASGLVTRPDAEFGGWGLTRAGRTADAELVAAELDTAGTREVVAAAYEGFLVLNPELLDLCTAWQTRIVDGVMAVNDHTDAVYDARVLDRFSDLDRRAELVCASLEAAVPRFGRYRVRLAEALARAMSGATEYVTDATASYHAVWFQLHEDLLATLGISRW